MTIIDNSLAQIVQLIILNKNNNKIIGISQAVMEKKSFLSKKTQLSQ